jgi:hypothetical protein
MSSIAQWDIFELELAGPVGGNPFVEVELEAIFSRGGRSVRVPGFYDGDGRYRIRFMPDAVGEWTYRTRSNVVALSGRTGRFEATEAAPGQHGPVRVRGQFHFGHADGTACFPFGTTCYAWTHQPLDLQAETLRTLAATRFNKIRMGVFPKHYLFNENEPLHPVFEQRDDGSFDFDRPNVAAFRHFETQVGKLRELGIEADVIIFHPYDRWGYCTMSEAQDFAYLRYLVARLAAYSNVWWSLANEYDFLLDTKPIERWDRFFEIIAENDPYCHPRSIHNGEETMNYDHRKPWVDHVCIQNWNVKATSVWRQEWGKPIVNDEPEYEGNILMAWGNISAQELVHRVWLTVTRGGYAGHGETYEDDADLLWWAKGGVLRGESWKRIGFLRDLLEADVKVGLEPASGKFPWSRVSMGREGDFRLIYLGEHQPATWVDGLPEDGSDDYDVDVIDTWAMTVTPAERAPSPSLPRLRQRGGALTDGKPRSAFAVKLPGKPFQAIRVKRRSGAR